MSDASYIAILISGLEKKISLLDQIVEENDRQLDILKDANSLPDDLRRSVDIKSDLIEDIDELDIGFEEVFSRVKDTLDKDRSLYTAEIKKMQSLIRQITDRIAQISSQETRNKDVALDKFTYIKDQIVKVSKSQKAVNQYYRNMMKASYTDAQFMDDKK